MAYNGKGPRRNLEAMPTTQLFSYKQLLELRITVTSIRDQITVEGRTAVAADDTLVVEALRKLWIDTQDAVCKLEDVDMFRFHSDGPGLISRTRMEGNRCPF